MHTYLLPYQWKFAEHVCLIVVHVSVRIRKRISPAFNPSPGTITLTRELVVILRIPGYTQLFKADIFFSNQGPRTRFLDTMSLHIATNGLTTFQRMLFQAKRSGSQRKEVQEAVNNPYFGEESPMVWFLYCKNERHSDSVLK